MSEFILGSFLLCAIGMAISRRREPKQMDVLGAQWVMALRRAQTKR